MAALATSSLLRIELLRGTWCFAGQRVVATYRLAPLGQQLSEARMTTSSMPISTARRRSMYPRAALLRRQPARSPAFSAQSMNGLTLRVRSRSERSAVGPPARRAAVGVHPATRASARFSGFAARASTCVFSTRAATHISATVPHSSACALTAGYSALKIMYPMFWCIKYTG